MVFFKPFIFNITLLRGKFLLINFTVGCICISDDLRFYTADDTGDIFINKRNVSVILRMGNLTKKNNNRN